MTLPQCSDFRKAITNEAVPALDENIEAIKGKPDLQQLTYKMHEIPNHE